MTSRSQALTDMDRVAMERLALSLGQPPFRGRQLFRWAHGRLETDPHRMANLPRAFAEEVARLHPMHRVEPIRELVSADGSTRKRLLRLVDGQTVEAVLMEAPASARESARHTVCVSSQVGCALKCAFCITGQVGFGRQLSPGEIVEQVYHFERWLRAGTERRGVTNIVFMGMGEPLANYEAVLAAVGLLTSPEGFGLGARHITISTAGIVPGIDRLAGEGLQLGLAVSLHAPDDAVREGIMPINRRYSVQDVVEAASRFSATTGRRVTYEYALIEGVNDGVFQARQLARLLHGRLCHVNLIPLNRSLDPALRPSRPERVAAFKRTLEEHRIPCTLRHSRGQDIMAACGQLRHRVEC